MIENIGFISTFFLGLCSLPLLIKTVTEGHCEGISAMFILMWFIGDITGVIYVINLGEIPLILNYGFNTIMATTMLVYKGREYGRFRGKS